MTEREINTIDKLKIEYSKIFGSQPDSGYFAPGRVNLIGEHTDYNGGHVLPLALDMGTYGLASVRTDDMIRLYSCNYPDDGIVSIRISDLSGIFPDRRSSIKEQDDKKDLPSWTNYPLGVVMTFIKQGYSIPNGFDMLIYGDIPSGAGLSSSASLEVLTGTALKMLFGLTYISPIDIARFSQHAENKYCGMNCGIMDQFASAMGIEGQAIFLNTSTMKFRHIPLNLSNYMFILTDSKVKHKLVDSEYNNRRSECNKALDEMQRIVDIDKLCDLTPAQFTAFSTNLSSPERKKRAYHAISENRRTLDSAEALENGDLKAFGLMMNESHISLRDYYEVSCEEVDLLVETAWNTPGILGSRMTGGGFGGCTISLIEKDALDEFKKNLTSSYKEMYELEPSFYEVVPSNGAHKLF
ncbi:galactokinase [Eubacterium xylanophilum]|uniref:galactokinase n=1 Tax=Eubacterium xylanophilum TaxID=39497 RepID=UPI0004BA6607|nr:galactokinase [Eubacterium xylanophilum]